MSFSRLLFFMCVFFGLGPLSAWATQRAPEITEVEGRGTRSLHLKCYPSTGAAFVVVAETPLSDAAQAGFDIYRTSGLRSPVPRRLSPATPGRGEYVESASYTYAHLVCDRVAAKIAELRFEEAARALESIYVAHDVPGYRTCVTRCFHLSLQR